MGPGRPSLLIHRSNDVAPRARCYRPSRNPAKGVQDKEVLLTGNGYLSGSISYDSDAGPARPTSKSKRL